MIEHDADQCDDDIMVEVLRRYQKTGRLVLTDRVVIGDRVYDPAVYMLTHAGQPDWYRSK